MASHKLLCLPHVPASSLRGHLSPMATVLALRPLTLKRLLILALFCCAATLLLTLVLVLLFLWLLCPLDLVVGIIVPAELPSIRLHFTQMCVDGV